MIDAMLWAAVLAATRPRDEPRVPEEPLPPLRLDPEPPVEPVPDERPMGAFRGYRSAPG